MELSVQQTQTSEGCYLSFMAGEFWFVFIHWFSCFQTKGKDKKEREKNSSYLKNFWWAFVLKTYKRKGRVKTENLPQN